jgi:hypothetical protein
MRLPPDLNLVHLILEDLADRGIPEPSVIISSGRGLYAKWYYTTPIPAAAGRRAVAVNRALVDALKDFGADPKSTDVSRVLRLPGSINSKSGRAVEIVWQSGKVYDFDKFATALLPFTPAELAELRAERKAKAAEKRQKVALLATERAKRQAERKTAKGAPAFDQQSYYASVVDDIRTLAALRHGAGTVRAGQRDMMAFIGGCALARIVPANRLLAEIQGFARTILGRDFVEKALPPMLTTLIDRARRHAAGERVEWHGRRVTTIYTYKASTMIALLQITTDEQRQMTALIDADEKNRRRREKRREGGMQERAEYEAQAQDRASRAAEMRAAGATWKEIGEALSISADAARKLSARAKNETGQVWSTSKSAKPAALAAADVLPPSCPPACSPLDSFLADDLDSLLADLINEIDHPPLLPLADDLDSFLAALADEIDYDSPPPAAAAARERERGWWNG